MSNIAGIVKYIQVNKYILDLYTVSSCIESDARFLSFASVLQQAFAVVCTHIKKDTLHAYSISHLLNFTGKM